MAQPDCERYLKRERNHRPHTFEEECVGAISSATEALAVSDLSVVSVPLQ